MSLIYIVLAEFYLNTRLFEYTPRNVAIWDSMRNFSRRREGADTPSRRRPKVEHRGNVSVLRRGQDNTYTQCGNTKEPGYSAAIVIKLSPLHATQASGLADEESVQLRSPGLVPYDTDRT